jgi:hypothetical protein
VEVLTVYVREAHPGERYPQPDTFGVKLAHARAYKNRDGIPWTVAVDDIDGTLHRAVDTKPNSAYFVGPDGRVVYRVLWSGDNVGLRKGFERLIAAGPPRFGETNALAIALTRGAGLMAEVLEASGPRAERDAWRVMAPAFFVAKIAKRFRPLPPVGRAVAALAMLAVAGGLGAVGWRRTFSR